MSAFCGLEFLKTLLRQCESMFECRALSQYATEKRPDSEKPWAVYNSYYDEKTADAQWRERERRDRIRQFTK